MSAINSVKTYALRYTTGYIAGGIDMVFRSRVGTGEGAQVHGQSLSKV